jgi:hypothetical protein
MHCTAFGQKTFCLKTIKTFDSRGTWYEVLVTDDEIQLMHFMYLVQKLFG